MDLKKLILTGMTVQEIEDLLAEKKRMSTPKPCKVSAIEAKLLKILPYKNPLLQ